MTRREFVRCAIGDEVHEFGVILLINALQVQVIIPGDGFFDVGNAYTWHDHYVKEYRFKGDLTHTFNAKNKLKAGFEIAYQDMQLVDVYKPWIGTFGLNNDAYHVYPSFGSLYAQDKITYKGMILNFGLRFDYWFPGKLVDDAINNPNSVTIPAEIKKQYLEDTYSFFGHRWKGRLSPRIGISHPITNNQTLFFSYGHFSKRPKPQFVYAKIANVSSKSSFQKFGNPNLTWWSPRMRVGYRSESRGDPLLTTGRYLAGGDPFVLTAEDLPETGGLLGFSFAAGSRWSSFALDYDADVREGFVRHGLRVAFRFIF